VSVRQFTATEKLAAVTRELKFRRFVYPQRVMSRKMTQRLADEQIALFEAIEADYQKLAEGERLL
jgi:hypothetical protein